MSNNKYKILLVEDEENILTLLAALLETNGYQVISAHDEASGKVMTYSAIIKEVWREFPDESNIKRLQVNMANIRKKLGYKPGGVSYIVNELGVGYRMKDASEL